jgi:hypothetical protein
MPKQKGAQMSERQATLNKARARMIEERDTHAKVLAAPFDRDKAERARNKFIEMQTLIDALDRAISGEVVLPKDWTGAEVARWMPHGVTIKPKETGMAKGEQRGNREAKKPKKGKIKTIAAAPSQKSAGWQPSSVSGKKK